MANRETNTANAASTTLTSTMGPTDLTATVDSTADFPSSPCYAVIDPDDDAKREIVYFDGTFTGTTLVTSVIGNRYLDGSAAGSGITHDPGAKVIVASGLSQLWTDINDRVDQHAHGGGTDGAQVDHGGLAGLADDDHTQYSLTSGARGFSAEVAGITPLNPTGLTTKSYVDGEVTSASDAITDGYPLGLRQVVTFTSSGTFTKATYSWLRAVRVLVVGGGGGSGGSGATSATEVSAGYGGGGGGWSQKFIPVASLGTSETVTVGAGGTAAATGGNGGAGGTTSFGTHLQATGGGGGLGGGAQAVDRMFANPTVGGVGTGGDTNGYGGRSGRAFAQRGDRVFGAHGGSSILAPGFEINVASSGTVGGSEGYGAGASGSAQGTSQPGAGGAAGQAGIVIVELYA